MANARTIVVTEGACSAAEAAKLMGVSQATFYRLRREGTGLRGFKLTEGRVGYLRREAIDWAEAKAAHRLPTEAVEVEA